MQLYLTCAHNHLSFRSFLTHLQLTYLPKKYHPFVVSPLRRIYLDESNEVINLERDVAKYKARLQSSREREELLMKECERHQKKSRGYRVREQEARMEKENLEMQCEMLVEKVSKVEKEAEYREQGRQRAAAKSVELQRDVDRLQKECVLRRFLVFRPDLFLGTKPWWPSSTPSNSRWSRQSEPHENPRLLSFWIPVTPSAILNWRLHLLRASCARSLAERASTPLRRPHSAPRHLHRRRRV